MKTLIASAVLLLSSSVFAKCADRLLWHYDSALDTRVFTSNINGKIEGEIISRSVEVEAAGQSGTIFGVNISPVSIEVQNGITNAVHTITIEKKVALKKDTFLVTLAYTVGNTFNQNCARVPHVNDEIVTGFSDAFFESQVFNHAGYISTEDVVSYNFTGFDNSKALENILVKGLKKHKITVAPGNPKFNFELDFNFVHKSSLKCEIQGVFKSQKQMIGNIDFTFTRSVTAPTCKLAVKKLMNEMIIF